MRFYFHAFLFYKKYILYFKDTIFTLHKQVEYHDRSFVIIVIPSVSWKLSLKRIMCNAIELASMFLFKMCYPVAAVHDLCVLA